MINGGFDQEFDALFEICVDRYHQLMNERAANALLKQEIKRLKLKEMH